MLITPSQALTARTLLKWSLDDAGKHAGINRTKIFRLEGKGSGTPDTRKTLRQAYEANGIKFLDLDGYSYVGIKNDRD